MPTRWAALKLPRSSHTWMSFGCAASRSIQVLAARAAVAPHGSVPSENSHAMYSIIDIPEPVRLKALAEGAVGITWLAELGRRVADLATAWDLSIGQTLSGGTEAFVTEAM